MLQRVLNRGQSAATRILGRIELSLDAPLEVLEMKVSDARPLMLDREEAVFVERFADFHGEVCGSRFNVWDACAPPSFDQFFELG